MELIHCVDYFDGTTAEDRKRNARARISWEYHYNRGLIRPSVCDYARDGRSIGGVRDLKFVKDVINRGFDTLPYLPSLEPSSNVTRGYGMLLTNSDSSLCLELLDFCRMLGSDSLSYSHRRDFDRPIKGVLTKQHIGNIGSPSTGVDLVIIGAEWWQKNRDFIPDLILGCEGWDWIFKFIVDYCLYDTVGLGVENLVAHETHGVTYWMDHRTTDPCNLWNRRLCLEWVEKLEPEIEALVRKNWSTLKDYKLD